MTVASTASCGGGLGERHWLINAQVPHDYARHDLDRHGAELAAREQLTGPGVVMLTAVDVAEVRHTQEGEVHAGATVGLVDPIWAADAAAAAPQQPGTINIVALLPVRLTDAALLNALCTVTEAKTQALLDAGVPGTGTPTDAVTVVCPTGGATEPFGGPRSTWGARLARAVYRAVRP